MLSGDALAIAITVVLVAAALVGAFLHWLWLRLGRRGSGEAAWLSEMAAQLHEAEAARDAATEALAEAEARLAALERERASERRQFEEELTRELRAAGADIEALRAGLANARQRILDLEAEIEALTRGVPHRQG